MSWLTNFVLPKIRAVVARKAVPDNLWHKCPSCGEMIHNIELVQNLYVCPKCDHHFTLAARERIKQLLEDPARLMLEV